MAQLALDQDDAAIGDGERGLHVLLDQDDGDAGLRLIACSVGEDLADDACGESPAEGSSRISTVGSTISARATASIWRCPPDSCPARELRPSRKIGEHARTARAMPLARARALGRMSAASCRFSCDRQRGEDVLGLRHEGEAMARSSRVPAQP